MMEWKNLLSSKRLGEETARPSAPDRTPFQQDFDRIVFSSYFRCLHDKTQVFPMSENPGVRNRLTHSLEASCIGRSLGSEVGFRLAKKYDLGGVHPSSVGAIVAAAALGHDIGNPPLGHAGEEAIQHWFRHSPVAASAARGMSEAERMDFSAFEGNAQGFRVLSKLQSPDRKGGMQLTCATLGAFAKYPHTAAAPKRAAGAAGKKYNFFQSERRLFAEVAETVCLKKIGRDSYVRHPLAFLVEAADDIAYRIVDFEDGFAANRIPYRELEQLFLAVIGDDIPQSELAKLCDNRRRVEFLRSRAIGKLIEQTVSVFLKEHDKLLEGELEQPLSSLVKSASPLQEIFALSAEAIYQTPRVVEVMASGYELFSGMLDIFVSTVEDVAQYGADAEPRSRRLIHLLPEYPLWCRDKEWIESSYTRVQRVTDFITGLSDSAAVTLYQKLKGIQL